MSWKRILVLFETNSGYVFGEIYPKYALDRPNYFQEISWEIYDRYGHIY